MGRNSIRKPVEKMMIVVIIIVLVLIVVQADHNPPPFSIISPNCFFSLKPCEDVKHVNRKRCGAGTLVIADQLSLNLDTELALVFAKRCAWEESLCVIII